jgi:hypothetical protein
MNNFTKGNTMMCLKCGNKVLYSDEEVDIDGSIDLRKVRVVICPICSKRYYNNTEKGENNERPKQGRTNSAI